MTGLEITVGLLVAAYGIVALSIMLILTNEIRKNARKWSDYAVAAVLSFLWLPLIPIGILLHCILPDDYDED